jgi:hypothetical protein
MNTQKYAGIASTALLIILAINAGYIPPTSATNKDKFANNTTDQQSNPNIPTSTEDNWTTKAPVPEYGSYKVVTVDGKIYAIGTWWIDLGYNVNEAYNPTTDNWTKKTPMPTPRGDFGIAVYNDKIYCIGGFNSALSAVGTTEVYDPQTDKWTTKTPMPTPRYGLDAQTVNGKIYLIGGQTAQTSAFLPILEVYDPETDMWTTQTSMPAPQAFYASTTANGKIYVIASGHTQIYDPSTDNWTLGADEPYGATYRSTASATTGQYAPVKIYVLGGGDGFFTFDYTRVYDPKNDSWSIGASMPLAKSQPAAVNINDQLYVVGGVDAHLDNRSVQVYTPADYGIINTPTPSPTTAPNPTQTAIPTPTPTETAQPTPTTQQTSTTTPTTTPNNTKFWQTTTFWTTTTTAIIAAVSVTVIIDLLKKHPASHTNNNQ